LVGGFIVVVVLVAVAIKYWYVWVPVSLVILLFSAWESQRNRRRRAEQDVVEQVEREAEAERRRELVASREIEEAARVKAWLAAPPPQLAIPTRFTEAWLAQRVPTMHPGQVPELRTALRSRGWSEVKVDVRLSSHLARNPYITDD
jgi:hypothetical protein